MPDPAVIKTWKEGDYDRWRLVYTGAQYELQEDQDQGWTAVELPEHAFAVLASLVAEEEGFND